MWPQISDGVRFDCTHFDRTGVVATEGELHHVDRVCSPVRHQVPGVVSKQIPAAPQEIADFEVFLHPQVSVMRPQRSRTAEQVEVDSAKRWLLIERWHGQGARIVGQFHFRDPPQSSVADELAGEAIDFHRPLLTADLQDSTRAFHGIGE